MIPEPLLVPFTDKGKEVSTLFLGICSGTENWNRRSNLGPMGNSPATGANGTSHTASGHLKAYARRAVINAQLKKLVAQSTASRFRTGTRGTSQKQRGRGHRRGVGWKLRSQMRIWSGVVS